MERTRSLFEPLSLGGITLANRIAVSPMCQYSAENGAANDWHLQHLGSLSVSGAGLSLSSRRRLSRLAALLTAVSGSYSDAQEAALARVVDVCRRAGSAALGIQLAHAGRKGSAKLPWEGGGPLSSDAGAWTTAAPSAIPFDTSWPAPQALDNAGMARVRDAHAAAAKRADRLGFDLVELLGAHGFLLHSFLSPISNRRKDAHGGSLATACATRSKWRPRSARSGRPTRRSACGLPARTGWMAGLSRTAGVFAERLREIGFDYVCVSSGGISPTARPPIGPG
jgi:2,4-dienoyl-CoA reductase-like NADH-dependent reductase (Old Yellow Enzyme family)